MSLLLKVLTIVVCLLVTSFAEETEPSSSCRETADDANLKTELYRAMRERFKDNAPYLVIPKYADLISKQIEIENEAKFGTLFRELLANNTDTFRVRLSGETRCDRKMGMHKFQNLTNSNISRFSSCPWHMVLDVYANRVPKSMAMAACTCQTCQLLNIGEGCPGCTCQEIVNAVPVVRRLCYNGTYSYITHIERVPVGCTCMKAARRSIRSRISP